MQRLLQRDKPIDGRAGLLKRGQPIDGAALVRAHCFLFALA